MSVRVDDFGAIGDGVTDDTPAIKQAEEALGGETGRIIEFSAKTYALGTRLETSKDGITYRGIRGAATIKQIGLTAAFKIQNDNITVEGLRFEGDQSDQTHRANQIEIGQASNVLIQNNEFIKSSSSAVLITSGCRNIRIEANTMLDFYENVVDMSQAGNSNILILGNIARTSVVSPSSLVSKPSGITMEPQSSGVNDGWIIQGNVFDFSELSASDRNNTFGIACQKHALPAGDFVLTNTVISDNVIIGAGHGMRLLDTRYGTTDQSFIGVIRGNMLKHIRTHGILVRGGEDAAQHDSLIVSGNSINGFSQATTVLYDGINLSQNLSQPLVIGNYISSRSGQQGLSTKGRHGISAADPAVVSPKIEANSIFDVQQEIFE